MNHSENKTSNENNNFSREEMEQFLYEKEQIRQIVGQVGGKPTRMGRIVTVLMIVLIIATLIAAPFLPKKFELPAVEIGLAFLSFKIFFLLKNEAKVTHFQFWMLSSLEWRMNDMSKRLTKMDENMKKIVEKRSGNKL